MWIPQQEGAFRLPRRWCNTKATLASSCSKLHIEPEPNKQYINIMRLVSDIKLITTDATLDLRQKAEKSILLPSVPPLLVHHLCSSPPSLPMGCNLPKFLSSCHLLHLVASVAAVMLSYICTRVPRVSNS